MTLGVELGLEVDDKLIVLFGVLLEEGIVINYTNTIHYWY